MSLQQTQANAHSIEVKMERFGQNQIRISWHPPVRVSRVSIFRGETAEFYESETHLVAIVTQGDSCTFQDPKPYVRGYYFVKFSEQLVIAVTDRVLPLRSVLNFRDMGGYLAENGRRVKWGKLFRSADLSRLTEADTAYLKALGIAWICDLRTEEEVRLSPSPQIGMERNENLSFLPSANPNVMMETTGVSESMLADMNRGMVGYTSVTAVILEKLLEVGGEPALFHCAAGKDRTGFVSSIILQAIGVPRETVLNDYAMTNLFNDRFKERFSSDHQSHSTFMSRLDPHVAQALLEARPAYLQASFDEIDAVYGGFDHYWERGLGFTAADREKLKHVYLAP